MKTISGIEYKVGQFRENVVYTLIGRAKDGKQFEIELSEDQLECLCCFPFGEPNREIEDSEINEVLNDWNQ